jgi:hypothetical protein
MIIAPTTMPSLADVPAATKASPAGNQVGKLCAGRITGDEYDRKARELKERQTEITLRIEQHQKGEGDYRTTLETLISVASRAAELFERSKTEQKRELLAFVFSNLRLRGKKLEFSLRSLFDLMVNRTDHTSWQAFLNTVRTETRALSPLANLSVRKSNAGFYPRRVATSGPCRWCLRPRSPRRCRLPDSRRRWRLSSPRHRD